MKINGKGEFTTTAQISERLVTYGNIKKPMSLNRLGIMLSEQMSNIKIKLHPPVYACEVL